MNGLKQGSCSKRNRPSRRLFFQRHGNVGIRRKPNLIAFDAGDDKRQTMPGRVSWISSQAEFTPTPIQTRDERSNLVYALKVRVANRGGVLKIGMPADVELPIVMAKK